MGRNNAGGNGGGLGVGGSPTPSVAFVVNNSIIADNNADGSNDDFDMQSSAFADDDNTLSGPSGGDLGPYRLFGGLTATQPIATSADMDVAISAACLDLDQRGAERDTTDCDPGAFERAGNPVIDVTNTNRNPVTISDDSNNVVILGLTLANNQASATTVGGFSGVINLNSLPATQFDFDVIDLSVLMDANGNGQLDDGETTLAGSINVNPNFTFTVAPGDAAGAIFQPGDSVSYLVVATQDSGSTTANWATPVYAGGALLSLLGLFGVGGLRRRTQWVLAVAVVVVGLTACGGGSGGSVGNNDNDFLEAPIAGDAQFVAFTVDAPPVGSPGIDFIVGDGMPVRGPGLTVSNN